MSGFAADWLALREPVDHASRNPVQAARMRAHFAGRDTLTIVDLGCGTGSNLRGLAGDLPPRQHWHLIDGDPALLERARVDLAAWAETARPNADGLELHRDGRVIEVSFEQADLTVRDLDFSDVGAELVTAAALFDLVSEDWLERLVARLATRKLPLYAVLNYDGEAEWHPAEPLDGRVIAAFNRHQRGDKGFGPALGPASSEALAQMLRQHGYKYGAGTSPWVLGPAHAALIGALTDGFAQAAGQIEPARQADFARWAQARAAAERVRIGHRDIFGHA
ncbi:class I SAM-dependent methyltransferase [Ancylobacter vacuolatus]|uniref:SAM-dependent methyltransferase n=1 Tax=Ancylobacter vacuolatus TaxID=223389 RepID=A0ABU0DE00_9HYPH|nr:class I SAM-dependent methyltransferase [Ancylobacter vacuolatus]MDQ0346651.1 SAM-dependent methyltransferase [Ancylobacter vacuolatus]